MDVLPQTLVLASNNAGKLREFADLLAPARITLISQPALGIPEAEEPHPTFIENALAKARHAAAACGLPALADDSGLCVHALNGAPGVHSARFAQRAGGARDESANRAAVLNPLAAHTDRRAYYICVLAYVAHPGDPAPILAEARWFGEIAAAPRGAQGFGYDPIFYLPELGKTVAELTPAEKNACSHRARAIQRLIAQMKENTACALT